MGKSFVHRPEKKAEVPVPVRSRLASSSSPAEADDVLSQPTTARPPFDSLPSRPPWPWARHASSASQNAALHHLGSIMSPAQTFTHLLPACARPYLLCPAPTLGAQYRTARNHVSVSSGWSGTMGASSDSLSSNLAPAPVVACRAQRTGQARPRRPPTVPRPN